MQRETSLPVLTSRVVIMPNLREVMNSLKSSIFCFRGTLRSMFAAVVGSAVFPPVLVFENDMLRFLSSVRLVLLWLVDIK